jgi:hypothetical protein
MFKNILKTIAFNARTNKLAAKLEAVKAAKEAARMNSVNLGAFQEVSKKLDKRTMRIERTLFRVGKINTLNFQAAI